MRLWLFSLLGLNAEKKLVKALPHTDLIVLSFVDFNKNRAYEFKVDINNTMKRIKFYLEAMSFFVIRYYWPKRSVVIRQKTKNRT